MIIENKNQKVVTRFAPSPTGDPHVGNIRTALFVWLFARHYGGKFILRIEDTDQDRLVPGSLEKIKQSLEWLGLNWDEYYEQSKRLDIYQKYAEQLLAQGSAYRCFCSKERLDEMRQVQTASHQSPRYDRKCFNLTKDEINVLLKKKIPYVIRFKIPEQGSILFDDLIRGQIVFQNCELDDQVILKSDGFPTYHLAVVVDDHLMDVTHVLRAEEWLSSTPKHILIYQALKWQPPKFAHLPMILGPDKSKLSKRHGAVSVLQYKEQGYLPQAIVNFLAFLGWNPGTNQEIFNLSELVEKFNIGRVQKGAAIFNLDRLNWHNKFYIKNMPQKELVEKCLTYLPEDSRKKVENSEINFDEVVKAEKERLITLGDINELTEYLFCDILEYDQQLLFWKEMTQKRLLEALSFAMELILNLKSTEFSTENIQKALLHSAKSFSSDRGELLWPMRVALSGQKASLPPADLIHILGVDKSIRRLEAGIKKVGM